MSKTRRIYFIRDETGERVYHPTLKSMRIDFDQRIADGIEPDTGTVTYVPTREGVAMMLNRLEATSGH